VALVAAFAAVTLTFLLASVVSQFWALAIQPLALEIAANAAPSIQHLAGTTAELRYLQVLTNGAIRRPAADLHGQLDEISATRARLARRVESYATLPEYRGEAALWSAAREDLRAVDAAVVEIAGLLRRGDRGGADLVAVDVLTPAADRASAELERTIDFNAARVREDALAIRTLRDRALKALIILDALGVLVTIGAAVVVGRGISHQARLQRRNAELLQRQVVELEAFAGRVAHDILGPLGGLSVGLDLLSHHCGADQVADRALARSRSSLKSVDQIVNAMLQFARSGAAPDRAERTEVAPVIDDVLADLQPAATASEITLEAEVKGGAVACARGVLLSVASNLMRNAVKHMGPSPRRHVTVRAFDVDSFVRLEVEDTGPGLAPEFVAVAFQPHVRGHEATQLGLGLGLATVRRLVEAHAGRVGVTTNVGEGSLFWVELPRAASQAGASAPVVATAGRL
jgi:signal transduction histidine kinase